MTVSELIAALQDVDPTLGVAYVGADGLDCYPSKVVVEHGAVLIR